VRSWQQLLKEKAAAGALNAADVILQLFGHGFVLLPFLLGFVSMQLVSIPGSLYLVASYSSILLTPPSLARHYLLALYMVLNLITTIMLLVYNIPAATYNGKQKGMWPGNQQQQSLKTSYGLYAMEEGLLSVVILGLSLFTVFLAVLWRSTQTNGMHSSHTGCN
jgi:hypothetical protein